MGVGGNDIDVIWESLKNEDGAAKTKSSRTPNYQLFDAGKKKSATARTKPMLFAANLGRPFDIDDAGFGEKVACQPNQVVVSHKDLQCEEDIDDACVDICGLNINETTPALYDSDDEDSEEDVPQQLQTSDNSWRIERVAKVLGSDDASSRVVALTKLRDTLAATRSPKARPLSFPPPYGGSHIKLNQNSTFVSDMAVPKSFEDSQLPVAEQPKSLEYDSSETRSKLQAILNVCGNALFRLVGDGKSEKCRSLALECLRSLLLAGIDFGRHMPYILPALCARYPPSSFDSDLNLFVQDQQMHAFYKRGGATDRQDRGGLFSGQGGSMVEPSEDLRLEMCLTIDCLLRGIVAAGAERTLDAYYPDIILCLQASLSDPFPDVKIEASRLLVQLLRIPHFNENGANKFFALGLARAALPNCRHRNTSVIISGVGLFEASVCVPDKAKRRGAGSSAIADLVGFREENALPIAAFYDARCGVSVNTLAELASHRNHRVRARACEMLQHFLVKLPDKYDHESRLLPYVLSFLNDDMPGIRGKAIKCIEMCGEQYGCEHPEEVLERRQFGVDGEDDTDYMSSNFQPFTQRPSLEARLFVRANTSRFYLAVLGELSNWKEETRKRSADLLLILAVYCEEHLTKDFHHTIASIAKAICVEKSSQRENDHLNILGKIQDIVCLMANYVRPDVFLPILCPRITGDNSSSTSNSEDGSHSDISRSSHAMILASMIKGVPPRILAPHITHLTSLLSGDECIGPFVGEQTREECLRCLAAIENVRVV